MINILINIYTINADGWADEINVQVFIPGAWSHATLNIEESIGFTQLLSHRAMAHEFQMPDDEPDLDLS
jgi:hypothetical protein